MLNKNFKWQRTAIVLAMVSLCCFLFAGAALAAPSLVVSPDTLCAGVTEELDITVKDINIDINCDLCGHEGDENYIEVTLPYLDPCRQWAIGDMDLIPVDVLVAYPDGTEEWVTSTVDPTRQSVNRFDNTVSSRIYIQCANLDCPQNCYAKEVKIRDFEVTAPLKSNAECYELRVSFNGTDPEVSARWCMTVRDKIGEVEIVEPEDGDLEVTAGSGFAVSGWVRDLCGEGLPGVPVTVSVKGDDVTVTTSGAENKKGFFQASLTAPECVNACEGQTYEVSAAASKVENKICGSESDAVDITVVGDMPAGVTWQDVRDINPDDTLVRDEILLEEAFKVTVTLRDGLCLDDHDNMVCPGNPTQAPEDVKVDLVALQNGEIAGYFYYDVNGQMGAQTNNVKIEYYDGHFEGYGSFRRWVDGYGDCSVDVWFQPILKGDITVEARAKYYNDQTPDNLADCTWEPFVVSNETPFQLVYTPLVYDNRCADEQRSGWPFQMAVWANNCADCDEFDVKVELAAENGTAMWSTELIKAYDVIGSGLYADVLKDNYQTYEHEATSAAQGLDHPCKSHFYVYTTPGTTSVDVRVKLICQTTGETWIQDYEDIDLTTPVELRRALRSEAWQVLSTPKYIAKPGVPFNPANSDSYGTFEDLLDEDIYSVIYTYDTYEPTKWVQVEATDKVEPLKAYFVKTRQFDLDDERAVVRYVFARATTPDATIPAVRSIDRSWNALGVAVQDNDHLPLLDDNGYCNPWLQGDSPYRALGTVGKGSKLIYNPEAMGNIVDGDWNTLTVSQDTLGSWVIDPVAGLLLEDLMFYNGDGYWIYMTNKQELAANVGLEIFGNYTGGGIN